MRTFISTLPKAAAIFIIFTLLCGAAYTGVVTGLSQLLFSRQANGSIIEVDGVKYGSALMGQQFTDDGRLWGRIMNLDLSTYTDKNGETLLYSVPSNLSPAGEKYREIVARRVERIRAANPRMARTPIPVDLVTASGSGLDPHISPAAAKYQADRIAEARGISKEQVLDIIQSCTDGKFLGIFGQETVNVLEANLMLEGILKAGK